MLNNNNKSHTRIAATEVDARWSPPRPLALAWASGAATAPSAWHAYDMPPRRDGRGHHTVFPRGHRTRDIVHGGGASPFEPLDLPAPSRHLDKIYAGFTLTNKAFACSLLGGARARDGLMMRAIAQGLDLEDMRGRPMIYGNVNTNSPRQLDASMADGLMTLARYGQPVVITPFTLCGAMAPATVAGALVQQNAEALAVIALAQAVNPSTPVVYGGFTSNVDMKTGAPAFVASECPLAGAHVLQGIEKLQMDDKPEIARSHHPIELFARAYGLSVEES